MGAKSSTFPSTKNVQTRDYRLKVVVIGDTCTGKTAIINRFANDFFSEDNKSTIGLEFALKTVKTNDDIAVRLQLWDIGCHWGFGDSKRIFYKQVVGCIVVYDITRSQTFDGVSQWKADLDNNVQLPNGNRVPCILLANKCDLTKDSLMNNAEKMNKYCEDKGFDAWFEASAKENINIESSIQYLVSEIMKHADDGIFEYQQFDAPVIK